MAVQAKPKDSNKPKSGEAESDFEFLDAPATPMSSMWSDLQNSPVIVRAGAATLPGMLSGYVVMKASKAAALGFGGGLLILFIANHYGLVTIHWDKLSNLFEEQKAGVKQAESTWRIAVRKVRDTMHRNPSLLAGFVSGFLIGMAYG